MTREAKIGMLTGLGVIVCIGVLLSEYLGDRNTGPSVAAGATGQGAVLPVGAGYREQIMTPVTVPAMTPAGGGDRTALPGGAVLASGIPTGAAGGGAAAGTGGPGGAAGVEVVGPVTPVVGGPLVADRGPAGGPPLIRLGETVPVMARGGGMGGAGVGAVPTGKTYVIVAGDTLSKIARKFYNAAGKADIQRIVAANPGVLKDATTMLVVGKKLTIPDLPVAAGAGGGPGGGAGAPAGGGSGGVAPVAVDGPVVPLPSGVAAGGAGGVLESPKGTGGSKDVATAKKPATYTMKAGDTLEKIARLQAPTGPGAYVTKLMKLNGIKDPKGLQAGTVLKLPA